ncbi:MAG TPA: hypothetical protein VF670_21395, partial [Duganella sp.]
MICVDNFAPDVVKTSVRRKNFWNPGTISAAVYTHEYSTQYKDTMFAKTMMAAAVALLMSQAAMAQQLV